MKNLKPGKKVLTLAVLLAMSAFILRPVYSNGNPNIDCPQDTTLVAKFNWENDSYVFEKPQGNETVVTITGDETGGTWTSTTAISDVIIKGATNTHTYSYNPSVTMGSFSKYDLPPNNGGQYPDISNIQFCAKATAVTLISFTAEASGDGKVTLTWETATEIDNAGFNIYRARLQDGDYEIINKEALIGAKGDAVSGANYSFADTPPSRGTYYYKLEDVDYYGISTMHGPEKVRVRSGNDASRRR
ncbi:MAG: hypothetical protein NG747_12315 [Candidatus Brocadia sp.]|nr:hypothetical protein [Candidatus Brocadia sp.]